MFISEFVKSYAGDAIRYPIATGGVVAAAIVGTILRPDLALSTISTVKNTTVKACSGALIGSAITLVAKSLGMQVTYSVGIKVVALTLTIKHLAITLYSNIMPKPDSNYTARRMAIQASSGYPAGHVGTDHVKNYESGLFRRNIYIEIVGSSIAILQTYFVFTSPNFVFTSPHLVAKPTSLLISGAALVTHMALIAFCEMRRFDTYFV